MPTFISKIFYRADNANNFLKLTNHAFFSALSHGINKNKAKFYFYSDNREEALKYGDFVSKWRIHGLILDMSDVNDIALIVKDMLPFFKARKAGDEKNMRWILTQGKKHSAYKIAKLRVAAYDLVNQWANDENWIALAEYYAGTFNSQHSTDDEFGVALKKVLKKRGYEGILFDEGRNAKTIALINKPKLCMDDFAQQIYKATNWAVKVSKPKLLKLIQNERYAFILKNGTIVLNRTMEKTFSIYAHYENSNVRLTVARDYSSVFLDRFVYDGVTKY